LEVKLGVYSVFLRGGERKSAGLTPFARLAYTSGHLKPSNSVYGGELGCESVKIRQRIASQAFWLCQLDGFTRQKQKAHHR